MKEITGDAKQFASKFNPAASQLAICEAKFMHNLLRIQFILK